MPSAAVRERTRGLTTLESWRKGSAAERERASRCTKHNHVTPPTGPERRPLIESPIPQPKPEYGQKSDKILRL